MIRSSEQPAHSLRPNDLIRYDQGLSRVDRIMISADNGIVDRITIEATRIINDLAAGRHELHLQPEEMIRVAGRAAPFRGHEAPANDRHAPLLLFAN